MINALFKDSLVYGLASVVQKAVPFFIIPIVTFYLGPDAFKNYDVSFTYAYLFATLVILGQDAAASLLYFDKKRNDYSKQKVTAYSFWIQIFSSALFLCLSLAFVKLISSRLFPNDLSLSKLFPKALLIVPGHICLNFGLNILIWQRRKFHYTLLCVLQATLSTILVNYTVVYQNGNTAMLFYSLAGSITITGIAAVILVRPFVFKEIFPLDNTLLRKLLLLGAPFVLTSFFHQAMPTVDRFFLLYFNYGAQMAPYILAVKIGALASLAISAFNLAFTPYSMSKLNEDDAEEEISQVFKVLYSVGFMCIPLVFSFRNFLIEVFADSTYGQAAPLISWILYGWLFELFSYFTVLGIYRSQKTYLFLSFYLAGFALISVANFVLIPQLGLYGAAVAFVLAKMLVFFFSFFYLRRYFSLHISFFKFGMMLILSICACLLIYHLPQPFSSGLAFAFFLFTLYILFNHTFMPAISSFTGQKKS